MMLLYTHILLRNNYSEKIIFSAPYHLVWIYSALLVVWHKTNFSGWFFLPQKVNKYLSNKHSPPLDEDYWYSTK